MMNDQMILKKFKKDYLLHIHPLSYPPGFRIWCLPVLIKLFSRINGWESFLTGFDNHQEVSKILLTFVATERKKICQAMQVFFCWLQEQVQISDRWYSWIKYELKKANQEAECLQRAKIDNQRNERWERWLTKTENHNTSHEKI
jgi:hypothetical protein